MGGTTTYKCSQLLHQVKNGIWNNGSVDKAIPKLVYIRYGYTYTSIGTLVEP